MLSLPRLRLLTGLPPPKLPSSNFLFSSSSTTTRSLVTSSNQVPLTFTGRERPVHIAFLCSDKNFALNPSSSSSTSSTYKLHQCLSVKLPLKGVNYTSFTTSSSTPPISRSNEFRKDFEEVFGQIPPVLVCTGGESWVAVDHLLSLPFAGLVFVDPTSSLIGVGEGGGGDGEWSEDFMDGLRTIPVLIIQTYKNDNNSSENDENLESRCVAERITDYLETNESAGVDNEFVENDDEDLITKKVYEWYDLKF